MFRVPSDPNHPTFDHTHKVSFWQWLTSSAQQRRQWRTLRDAAAQAQVNQADARVARAQDARQHRQAAKRARKAARRGGTYKTR